MYSVTNYWKQNYVSYKYVKRKHKKLIKVTFIWTWKVELNMASNDDKCDVCVCVCVRTFKTYGCLFMETYIIVLI
jgi:hypothetical protein